MTIYIALLRAINVGGNNKIRMADLKLMLQQIGLEQVQTYIQSGNVLFKSGEEAEPLRTRIEQHIRSVTGIPVTIVLRTTEEWDSILADCPFAADALTEGESLHVSLLTEPLEPKQIERLAKAQSGEDEFRSCGREVYMLMRQRVSDSKLAIQMNKVTTATTRNWNTMRKLAELAQAMKA